MDYKLIEKPAFDVVGKARKFTTVQGENFIKIPQFWNEFMKDKSWDTLMKLSGGKEGKITGGGSLGVCIGNEENFSYAIGVEKPDKAVPSNFDVFHIPAATWAVFDCTLDNLQDITKRIFSEWFPSTGYEHAAAPEIEVYLPGDFANTAMKCQIWIPIVKKKKK